MRRKYLLLLLVALAIALGGCKCDKKHVAPPPAPSAPSNLTGTAVSSTQIDLTWKDNSANEKGFYVYRRTTGGYARVGIMEANATSYSDSGLSPETTYWYKVTAYNDGGESGSSNEVSIATPAGPTPPLPPLQPPSNVTATTASYKQINLSWRDNSNDEDSFRIACDMGVGQNQFLARVPANTTRYEHGNLQPMTEYKYYVVAERGGDSASSEQVSAATPCPATVRTYGIEYLSDTLVKVWGTAWCNIYEYCRLELTAFIYDSQWDLIATNKETFEPFMPNYYPFDIEVALPSAEDEVNYRVEVTDMEIEY